METHAPKAVFLSYAREDVTAARRIAEALRSSGIEVWFDENELRGGDAWDQKIRRQIKECSLFLAIISSHTQERGEGYFRLEWNLAVERTHRLAEGVPFLVPVVVDDTPESEASAPAPFLDVQWMRQPAALPTPQFIDQVKRLLAAPRQPAGSHKSEDRERGAEIGAEGRRSAAPRSATAKWLLLATAVLVIGVGGYFAVRPTATKPAASPPASSPEAKTQSPVPLDTAAAKSLIVLPLENLSPDPENAFFTDGIHAEIITTLSRIPDLKVISRDSAVALRGSPLSLAEKARRVGVVNVLTGSVRREGDRVRVSLELRRAADETLLWSSPKADRALTDRLALQDEIASEVARALQAREARGTYASAQFMTSKAAAFELFSKAEWSQWSRTNFADAIRLLEEALQLDPQFMTAASALSRAHYTGWLAAADDNAKQRHMTESKKWAEVASRLVPGGAGDSALAHYYAMMERDNLRALQLIDGALRALPNEALNHNRRGIALAQLGRMTEAVSNFQRSIELDPLNNFPWNNLLRILSRQRRPDEFNRVAANAPVEVRDAVNPFCRFVLFGELPSHPQGSVAAQIGWLMKARRFDEALKLSDANPTTDSQGARVRFGTMVQRATILLRLGRTAGSRELGQALLTLAKEMESVAEFDPSEREERSARALVFSDRPAESIAAMTRYVGACSPTKRTFELWLRRGQLAELHAHFNQRRDAVEIIRDLLRVPCALTVPMLKVDPVWDNLRDDPAFQALLADPKNSAPLF